MDMNQMQGLVDMCDPEGAAQREWESARAEGKRVTGFSGSVAGQEPAAPPADTMVTPAGVGPKQDTTGTGGVSFSKQKKKITIAEGDIWDADEVDQCAVSAYETRARPDHEVLFRQAVGSSDVFLGLDYEKDPSSACCEEMVVRVSMPKEHSAQDIHLDIKADTVDLRSPHYRLLLPLQKPVLENKGSAKWEKDKQRMNITLVVDKSQQGVTKLV